MKKEIIYLNLDDYTNNQKEILDQLIGEGYKNNFTINIIIDVFNGIFEVKIIGVK